MTARQRREAAERERSELLEQGSIASGARWAASWREALRREGRPISGGWPGTLSEARARVSALSPQALSWEERERMARLAYAAARREWLSQREADPESDD